MGRLNDLQSNSSAIRCKAIVSCIEEGNVSPSEITLLKALINDENVIVGRKLSSFAKAALDILQVQKNDSDPNAEDLIKALGYLK